MKMDLISLFRAFLWIVIGVGFGLASIFLVLASSSMFVQHGVQIKPTVGIDSEVIIFLCLALMSGAGADFVLTPSNHHWAVKGLLMLTVFTLLFVAFWLLSPNSEPKENVVNSFTLGYCVACFFYCLFIKAI